MIHPSMASGSAVTSAGGLVLGTSKMHVSGFPLSMDRQRVEGLVAQSGPLKSFEWPTDASGQSVGHAVFEYVNPASMDRVVQSLNGMPVGEEDAVLRVARLDTVLQEEAARQASAAAGDGGGDGGGSAGGAGGVPGRKALVSAPVNPNPTVEANVSKVLQAAHQVLLKAVAEAGGSLPAALLKGRSNVLKLMNLLTAADVQDPFQFDDIQDDIREECSMYGTVVDVRVNKPPPDTRPLPEDPLRRKNREEELAAAARRKLVDVYVQFDSADSAQLALLGLVGRTFAGRVVTGTFVTREAMDAVFATDPA